MSSYAEASEDTPRSIRLRGLALKMASHPKLEEHRVAEREGFEPPLRSLVNLISSQTHSTTLPPLRVEKPLFLKRDAIVGELKRFRQAKTEVI